MHGHSIFSMYMLLSLIIIFGIVLCCAELSINHNPACKVCGKVVDGQSLAPISGVKIWLNGKLSTTTDTKGEFCIVIAQGDMVRWSLPSYQPIGYTMLSRSKKMVYKLIKMTPENELVQALVSKTPIEAPSLPQKLVKPIRQEIKWEPSNLNNSIQDEKHRLITANEKGKLSSPSILQSQVTLLGV